jgi:hypothetical protein
MIDYDKCKTLILQSIALVAINVLAFVYDGQYVPLAIGVDALVLGFNLRDLIPVTQKVDEA